MKTNRYPMKNINSNFILIQLLFLTIFITSCSLDPVDKTYNKHTADDDFRRIRDISNIDSADQILLGRYMIDKQLAGNHILETHTTYKDILAEAKKEKEKYETEQKRKGKNEIDIAKSHENEKIKALKKVLFVDFVKEETLTSEEETLPKKWKKPAAPENKNNITFNVLFKNISEKDIQAFKGDLNFYDIFHTEIKKITFSSFKQINVGDSIVQKFTLNLDEINKSSNTIYNDLSKDFIKVEWLPERLIHTDDTVIE